MKKRTTVYGIIANAPRPTRAAAFLFASALSVPVYVILNLITMIWP